MKVELIWLSIIIQVDHILFTINAVALVNKIFKLNFLKILIKVKFNVCDSPSGLSLLQQQQQQQQQERQQHQHQQQHQHHQ